MIALFKTQGMKIEFWWIGKTNEKYLKQGLEIYLNRLKHYNRIEITTLPDVKALKNQAKLKELEANSFLSKISNQDFVILCDEKGKEYDFNDIDLEFYEDFVGHLQSNKLATNTIGKKIQTPGIL